MSDDTDQTRPLSPPLRALVALLLLGVTIVPLLFCTGIWSTTEMLGEFAGEQADPEP